MLLRLMQRFLVMPLLFLGAAGAMSIRSHDPGEVAQKFINSHISRQDGYEETMAWVMGRPEVTARFKQNLTKIYGDALAEDPDYGYGADAIIGGQDAADSYQVESCVVKADRARVVLAGRPPYSSLKIHVELVLVGGRWMVDGSGDHLRK